MGYILLPSHSQFKVMNLSRQTILLQRITPILSLSLPLNKSSSFPCLSASILGNAAADRLGKLLRRWAGARSLPASRQSPTEAVGINPLDGHFSKKRVRVTDFFHPFFRPTAAAKFEDCELLGPGVIYLDGGQLLLRPSNRRYYAA